jgi:hypothetical protein
MGLKKIIPCEHAHMPNAYNPLFPHQDQGTKFLPKESQCYSEVREKKEEENNLSIVIQNSALIRKQNVEHRINILLECDEGLSLKIFLDRE